MKPYHLGLDVGGTNLAAAVYDNDYRMLSHRSIPAGGGRCAQAITADMAAVSRAVIEDAGISVEDVECWGIGMPSCIDTRTRLLVNAHQFGWKNVPIREWLEPLMPLPVRIENDANCAAYGEALAGAARGRSNVVMLTLGTGVGSGIIIDGRIFKGYDGMGAEIGHSTLVQDGRPCACGRKGCVEAYCSATALIARGREVLGEACTNAKYVFTLAQEGNTEALALIDEYAGHLTASLSSIVTIFRPEVLILGGGVADSGDFLLDKVNALLPEMSYNGTTIGVPPVVRATLGNAAGLIGAAFL